MKILFSALVFSSLLCGANTAVAQAVVGKPAPTFTATATSGKSISLSDYKGKYVVLEWMNPECPFVNKHYNGGNMPATQKRATAAGAIWLSINTSDQPSGSKPVRDKLQGWMNSQHAAPTAVLLDDGTIGQAYGARTTPHMYIINPRGQLIYTGAIDSKPTADPADIKTATNYVTQALSEAMANKPVARPNTQAYGCSVQYPRTR